MPIWVDADSCPKVLKDILFKAAERRKVQLILVANHSLAIPRSALIRLIQVEQGFDVADRYIEQRIHAGDLLISNDIPLAAAVVAKGALCITTKGRLLTPDNISDRLTMRNLQEELRSSGMQLSGPAPLSAQDKQQFANQLDQWLQKQGPVQSG